MGGLRSCEPQPVFNAHILITIPVTMLFAEYHS